MLMPSADGDDGDKVGFRVSECLVDRHRGARAASCRLADESHGRRGLPLCSATCGSRASRPTGIADAGASMRDVNHYTIVHIAHTASSGIIDAEPMCGALD
jgi:hypothetical protein